MHGAHLAEFRDFRLAVATFAVFLQNVLEVVHGVVGEVFLVVVHFLDLLVEFFEEFVGLLAVKAADAAHRDFGELEDFFAGHFATELAHIGLQAFVNQLDHLVVGLCLLDDLVDFLLDEDLLEARHVPLVLQVLELVVEFPVQEVHGVVGAELQEFGRVAETRLLVDNHAAVRGKGRLAVGKRVERVHHDLRVGTCLQVDLDFHVFGGVVHNLLDLDFALVVGGHDGVDKAIRGSAEGDFADDERLVVQLLDLCTDLEASAAFAVVVFANVDDAARVEVRVQRELAAAQVVDARLAQLLEVVGEDGGGKAHRDAVHALRQQDRELGGERHRFLGTAVVVRNPVGRFGIEHHVERKFAEFAFDVTRGSGLVARQRVTPVTLRFDKQVLLAHVHEGRVDGGVAMRMVVHGVAHDARHLVETAVVHLVHGMQNAALHRLEAVLEVGHGAVENRIARVVQEPAVVQLFQVVYVRKS